ncbi:MAG: ErfK/YbiS/YcfS/YnhG family protein [Frankiales bacterium]|nr:ErfK/YbiS/YcfS/YnhG family protein [Frankiales bacterium]
MTTPAEPPRSRHVVPAILAGIVATLLLAAGGAVWLSSDGGQRVAHAAVVEPVPVPVLTAMLPSGPRMAAPWSAPLTLSVMDGTLKSVTVLDPDGTDLAGAAVDGSTWQSAVQSLLPDATYRVTATVVDKSGEPRPMTLSVHTTPAARVLHAVLSPGDGDVVGVGMPLIVTLNHPVKSSADRAALISRLTVVTTPAVAGAWRWMDNSELHYRAATYWTTGTAITLSSNLRRLQLSDGTWGSGTRRTTFHVGDAMISTVDVTKHVMAIRRNGKLLRIAKVSTGRDKYPTKGGVHIVLEKTKLKVMDSATVGIPRNSPDGYFEKVPFSVRISNGGAFVHAASWSVRSQGVANVSHGCVNMSPADAQWFFGLAKRGDVVNVINASVKPVLWDAGMSDWNIPFAEWAN